MKTTSYRIVQLVRIAAIAFLWISVGVLPMLGAQTIVEPPNPTQSVGGPVLKIDNNTNYALKTSEVIWGHAKNGYWYGGPGGSKFQYDIPAGSHWSRSGGLCNPHWGASGWLGGVFMKCYWGNQGEKEYNESRSFRIYSEKWDNKDGILINVKGAMQGDFEVHPGCAEDKCTWISWKIVWDNDGWKIILNQEEKDSAFK